MYFLRYKNINILYEKYIYQINIKKSRTSCMFIIYKKRIFIYTLRENNKIDQLS